MPDPLTYKATIAMGGIVIAVVEDYEAVLDRIRDSSVNVEEADAAVGESPVAASTRFMVPGPIELTARGEDDRPIRAAFNPNAITAVYDIPLDARVRVAEGDPN